jgi:uncharacterized protein (TIGR02996 family)
MPEMNEADFLRSIACDDDNAARLVLADWLEERGDRDRAEFVRVQCELTSSGVFEDRRRTLRLRERELLDAHRQKWLQAFALPLEDVCFQGGLIASARLSEWSDGRLLDGEPVSRLATLRELDLSGLGIGDDQLRALAEDAHFPALRKLILSDNEITNTGAAALAKAAGLPRLETVYLFQNPASDAARVSLERATHFLLGDLDVGEHVEGYSMSPGETDVARRLWVRSQLLPLVSEYFRTYSLLQSAMLCVAQYWNDNAHDAVHAKLIVSELFEPTMEEIGYRSKPDPNLPNTKIKSEYAAGSLIRIWRATGWDDNYAAIPLWAAFAPEDGNQNYDNLSEAYRPAVMFYRHGGYEILPMCRPHLDGILPEWAGRE